MAGHQSYIYSTLGAASCTITKPYFDESLAAIAKLRGYHANYYRELLTA